MPFTFSHPALILPFLSKKRKWLSASGLIAGSLVPDFEYFLRMRKGFSQYSHTWQGLIWFDLPFAILLTFVFHQVVRNPLIQSLPQPLYSRFASYININWLRLFSKALPVVFLSILVGILTHFGWDWILHESVDYLYVNQSSIFAFDEWQGHMQIYTTVLAGHSLVGLIAIIAFIKRMSASSATDRKGSVIQFWGVVLLLTGFMTVLRIMLGEPAHTMDILVSLIAAFLLSLLLISFWLGHKGTK
jgi:hypothetical protein